MGLILWPKVARVGFPPKELQGESGFSASRSSTDVRNVGGLSSDKMEEVFVEMEEANERSAGQFFVSGIEISSLGGLVFLEGEIIALLLRRMLSKNLENFSDEDFSLDEKDERTAAGVDGVPGGLSLASSSPFLSLFPSSFRARLSPTNSLSGSDQVTSNMLESKYVCK